MVEDLELRETKEQNLANSVNNLANTVIAPEITETVAKFIPLPDSGDQDQNYESGMSDTTPNVVGDTITDADPEPSEYADLGFEHFFDGDFGQQNNKPSHDEPAVRGLK